MITITTLEVDKGKYNISDDYITAMKTFIASLHSDINKMVTNKEIVCNKLMFGKDRPNEEELARGYDYDSDLQIVYKLQGFHREVFGSEKITMTLPGIKGGIKVRDDYIKYMILLPLVKDGFFDDEYLNFIKPFLFTIPLYYNKETGKIGFSIDKFNESLYKLNFNGVELSRLNVTDITNDDLLSLEVKQGFINKEIGDKDRGFGFTHKIRELLGMKFFYWQKQVIKTWSKINVVFAVRNSGKTAFACYIGLREIISEKNGFGIRKNRKIIYFVPDKVDVGEQVMDYIVGYIDAIFDSVMQSLLESHEYKLASEDSKDELRMTYITQLNKLRKSYFKVDRAKYSVTCNLTGNSLKLVSLNEVSNKSGRGLGTSKGEGLACDVYIIDEAPRIPDSFWHSFWERAETESDYGYISGTLNLETPKDHWSYKLALEGELGNPDISAHRIALWNNEALFMRLEDGDEKGKKDIIERERQKLLKISIQNLYCRGYGIILDEKKVLNLSGSIVTNLRKGEKYHRRVLVFDFGGDHDPAAWFIYNINTMTVEESSAFLGSIKGQLAVISQKKSQYKHLDVIGDGTGAKGYLVMGEDKNNDVDIYISFSSGPKWNLNSKGSYSVDKGYMVDLSQQVLDRGLLQVDYKQTDFISHCKSLVRLTDKNAKVQQFSVNVAKGDEHHHADLAMCLLMLSAYLAEGLGITEKNEFEKYGLEFSSLENNPMDIYHQNNDDDDSYFNGLY